MGTVCTCNYTAQCSLWGDRYHSISYTDDRPKMPMYVKIEINNFEHEINKIKVKIDKLKSQYKSEDVLQL
jgi:hypothetical protein